MKRWVDAGGHAPPRPANVDHTDEWPAWKGCPARRRRWSKRSSPRSECRPRSSRWGISPQRQAENAESRPDPRRATGRKSPPVSVRAAGKCRIRRARGASARAAREQLNSGRSGQGRCARSRRVTVSRIWSAPRRIRVHGPDAVARNEAETERRLAESDAAFRANP